VRALALNPHTHWTARELADRVGVQAPLVRQTLRALVRAGFAQEQRAGMQSKFAPAPSPAYEALQAFVYAAGMPDFAAWARAFASAHRRLRLIVVAGVFVGDTLRPDGESPEVLVVADHPEERVIQRWIGQLEREVGRDLAVAVFSTAAFRYRQGIGDRAIREVRERPHRVVRGSW
jgi:hypothetical protein